MNILVIGRGWVGKKVFAELSRKGHSTDITSHEYAELIDEFQNYDWIVNCAGITGYPNVDACEKKKYETIQANAYYPVFLYKEAVKAGAKFAHFSSGCVYQGNIEDVYAEPNYFGSIYSTSKGISDSYLSREDCLLFRVRMPFTDKNESKNLLTKLTNYAKSGKLVEGGPNSITDLDEAINVASNLIEENKFGVYNLVNEGYVTTHQLAEMLGLTPEWYTSEEFKNATAAARSNCTIPSNAGMRNVYKALEERINTLKGTL
jgi:dTDP-4-dehydrorhamnose reductase